MRLIFYIFLISQLLNFLGVFAEKVKEHSTEINPIIWEKVKENTSKPSKKIIWKSYKEEENNFNNGNKEGEHFNQTDLINTNKWRFRLVHQWYFNAQRENGSTRDIQLLGGKIDWIGGDWWYLTGQGFSEYEGGGGSYSEGQWGIGVFGPRQKNWQIYCEMLIGAGGGGGVDSDSSLLFKPSIGLEYNLNNNFSFQTGIGKVISKEGKLDANTLEVGLLWRFGAPK